MKRLFLTGILRSLAAWEKKPVAVGFLRRSRQDTGAVNKTLVFFTYVRLGRHRWVRHPSQSNITPLIGRVRVESGS